MAENNNNSSDNQTDQKFVGLLAQFEDPQTLVEACNNAREHGYKKMDAYTPFPVHGIDPAIGIPRTILPFIVLAVGLGAVFVGLGLQYYTNNKIDTFGFFPGYEFMIGGKPYFSLPANIPVTFEIIVLSSAFATFFGMWILNGLPRLANPLHRISRFKRATNDKFFLMIEDADEKFVRSETESQMNSWGASAIEEVNEDLTDTAIPNWIRLAGILTAFLLLLPPVIIYRAAGMTSRTPRMHVVPDMDWQDKFKTQTVTPDLTYIDADGNERKRPLFVNMRSMQKPIAGTIARGGLETDVQLYQGIQSGTSVTATVRKHAFASLNAQDEAAPAPAEPNWLTTFPEQITVDLEFLKKGQNRFEIYCSPCHGYSGNGDGLVNQRALALGGSGAAQWTAAKSLHDPEVKKNPVGRIFDTISNGRSSMGPYKGQISTEDRWAIVAYVKALQGTGIQPPSPVAAADADQNEDGAEKEAAVNEAQDSSNPKP